MGVILSTYKSWDETLRIALWADTQKNLVTKVEKNERLKIGGTDPRWFFFHEFCFSLVCVCACVNLQGDHDTSLSTWDHEMPSSNVTEYHQIISENHPNMNPTMHMKHIKHNSVGNSVQLIHKVTRQHDYGHTSLNTDFSVFFFRDRGLSLIFSWCVAFLLQKK